MIQSRVWRYAMLGFVLAGPAAAQVVWDTKNISPPPPTFVPSAPVRKDMWPRLDQGAVLCKTEADLGLLAAARRGEQVSRPNCRVIRAPTAIQIVRRAAPGRTEVSLTDQDGQSGWTDAWLPDRAVPTSGPATVVK
jgi:hypothetical protein